MEIKPLKNSIVTQAAKLIRGKNAAFVKANMARKRVMIAEDVIGALVLELYTPEEGDYLIVTPKGRQKHLNLKSKDTQMQSLFSSAKDFPECQVCGIGMAMVSTLRVADNLTVEQFNRVTNSDDSDLRNFVEGHQTYVPTLGVSTWASDRAPWFKIFGRDMLNSIEGQFEHYHCSPMSDIADTRLRSYAIYENIVLNKGEFHPPPGQGFCKMGSRSSFEKEVRERFNVLKRKEKKRKS